MAMNERDRIDVLKKAEHAQMFSTVPMTCVKYVVRESDISAQRIQFVSEIWKRDAHRRMCRRTPLAACIKYIDTWPITAHQISARVRPSPRYLKGMRTRLRADICHP